MESIEIFTAAILIIGALHFVVTVGTRVSLWWNETISGEHVSAKGTDAASTLIAQVSASPRQQRSDWYAFFHCSDLLGLVPTAQKPQVRPEKTASVGTYRQSTKRLSLRPESRL